MPRQVVDRDTDLRRLQAPSGPTESAERLRQLERVETSRRRTALGCALLILGVFFVYPSWKMFFFLLVFLIWGITRLPTVHVSVFSGLPYGKMAPVLLARKPWWQTILFPLHSEMRELWTGLVSVKSVHRMEFIGRVRLLLIADMWYMQCGDPKLGWRIDVRLPVGSPVWRTCYTCPATPHSTVPPPSSDGGWKYVGVGAGVKKAENTTLHLEVAHHHVKEWFDRRRPPEKKTTKGAKATTTRA